MFNAIENYSAKYRQELYEASSKLESGANFSALENQQQEKHIKAINAVIEKYSRKGKVFEASNFSYINPLPLSKFLKLENR